MAVEVTTTDYPMFIDGASVASSGGASGSTSATSPPDATQVDVTSSDHWSPGFQAGCARRQNQRPGATSCTLTTAAFSQAGAGSSSSTTSASWSL